MKIAELCPFSIGICGVWSRVQSESREFISKGHEVTVFSSNIEKGTGKHTKILQENADGIRIMRFRPKKYFFNNLLSENVHYWFGDEAKKSLMEYNPDIVITHLMHPHSASLSNFLPILKKKNMSLKSIIVPHAPFNVKRRFPLNFATTIWGQIGGLKISNFDKVIAITHWEKPYLHKLKVNEEKIVYIPNGLSKEYFSLKKSKSKLSGDVLFLGRISPVKNLETLVKAAKGFPKLSFSIVGAAEPDYLNKIKILANGSRNINIYPPVYNLIEKIKILDSHKIFVLPSFREAMPQTLIEAMSRGLIAISSNTDGGRELIINRKNGLIFPINNYLALEDSLRLALKSNEIIRINAKKSIKQFAWKKLIKKYEEIFNS